MRNEVWKALEVMDFGGVISKATSKVMGLGKFRITCLQIHVTDKCNMGCVYCYAKNHRGDTLSQEKMESLLEESKKLGVHEIQIVGGEPFMYEKFKNIIDRAYDMGFNIRVYTNGLLIDDKWVDFLKKYHKKIFPTHLAVTEAIAFGLENGLKLIDLMGAGRPDESYGVRDYKLKFGGDLVEHGRFIYILNPLFYKIGLFGIKIMRKFQI